MPARPGSWRPTWCGAGCGRSCLTPAERVGVIRAVRDAVPAEIQVLAGTGAPAAQQAAELTEAACTAAADAVLAGPPPCREGLGGFGKAGASPAGRRSVLAYQI